MNTAELLKPRYKVIADYPFSDFNVGDILNERCEGVWTNDIENGENISAPETYPHLFRKLEWHEEREKKDMPEYLRSSETYPKPHFIKVRKNYATFFEGEYLSLKEYKPYWEAQYQFYFPATETEYQQYLLTQK